VLSPAERDDLGVEVLTLEQLDDDRFLDRFTAVAAASVEDMPGEPPPTVEENRQIERRRIDDGGFAVLLRTEGGELAACATASAAPWSPWITSDHTLVLPAFRGRGFGLAAKRAQHAVAAQRGFERVVTDVRPSNAPMLAILRRLGYASVPTPTWVRSTA
jgi:RimJ/RimL family protein N-acetyltransferase